MIKDKKPENFILLDDIDLSSVIGGGKRAGSAFLSGAASAAEGAMVCFGGGPWLVAGCAAGAFVYGAAIDYYMNPERG
ncbi:Blp family class II bacteriocin [Streptococcus merionis]|uniref:Blp family class II bacteriocin n=1 Tax=Streptococcus merionis TaxID=400065 RepID=UPI0035122C1F